MVRFVLPAGNDSRRRLVEFVGGLISLKWSTKVRRSTREGETATCLSSDRGSWIMTDILDLTEQRSIIWVSTNSLSLFSFFRTIHHSRDPLIFMWKRRLSNWPWKVSHINYTCLTWKIALLSLIELHLFYCKEKKKKTKNGDYKAWSRNIYEIWCLYQRKKIAIQMHNMTRLEDSNGIL